MRKLLTVICALGVLLPAAAEEAGSTLAVSLDAKAEDSAATLDYVLRQTASQSTRIRYVDISDIARGENSRKRRLAAQQADQALQSGKLAYQNLEFEGALRHFEEAIGLYEQADLSVHMPGMLATYAMMGATQYFSGDVRKSRQTLTRLLSLRTDYTFNREVFSPDVLEVVEEIRAGVQGDHGYSLEVLVSPQPARVYVDGVFRGMSPQELRDLAPGPHYVTVDAPGYALEQDTYQAGPGAMAKVTLAPALQAGAYKKHQESLRKAFGTGEVSGAAAAMARWCGVDEVVVAGVTSAGGKKVRLVAARVAKDGHLLAHAELDLDMGQRAALGEASALVKDLFAHDLPRGPGGAPIVKPLKVGKPMGSKVWSYVSLGVGASALATGTVFAFQARSAARDAKALPQIERDAIAETVSKARTRAAVADTLMGLSLAAIGTGIYLIIPPIEGGGSRPEEIIEEAEDDPFAVAPWILPGGAGVVVGGRF
ncbi:MAG: PEGA domain-containing protein [Deltaproteobacteria bacterium]|nr:PEGA domain-containing protein [Deltaproteobacteria bacterium]